MIKETQITEIKEYPLRFAESKHFMLYGAIIDGNEEYWVDIREVDAEEHFGIKEAKLVETVLRKRNVLRGNSNTFEYPVDYHPDRITDTWLLSGAVVCKSKQAGINFLKRLEEYVEELSRKRGELLRDFVLGL